MFKDQLIFLEAQHCEKQTCQVVSFRTWLKAGFVIEKSQVKVNASRICNYVKIAIEDGPVKTVSFPINKVIFNSYVNVYQRVHSIESQENTIKSH